MTFLPIVFRELRVASRRPRVYWTRLGSAASAIVLCFSILHFDKTILNGGSGRAIFGTLAGLCFVYCMMLGADAADCISQEKRDGTLGLLFLTDLKGHDVALGKLFATSLNSFYCVMGFLPVVALALLFGGVTAGEFSRAALALLNAFFFSHTAGLFVSTISREQRTAVGNGVAILLGYTVIIPVLAYMLGACHWTETASFLGSFNPGFPLYTLANAGVRPWLYWQSLVLVHLNAWLFLATASRWLPECWQEKASRARLGRRDWWRRWLFGPPALRAARRRELIAPNPFLWIASRKVFARQVVWFFFGILCCLWTVIGYKVSWSECEPVCLAAIVVQHLLLVFGVAAEAGRSLDEYKHNGGLELVLCTTPVQEREILAGQWLALRRLFLGPLLAILISDLAVGIVAVTFLGWRQSSSDQAQTCWFLAALMVVGIIDVVAVGWIGMWRALAKRQPRHAPGESVAIVIFLPLAFFWTTGASCNYYWHWFDSFASVLSLWFGYAAAIPIIFAIAARRQLLTRFRDLATVQSVKPPGIFARLGKAWGNLVRPSPK